jgi:3-deoxy-manno-octulosonate cytidylyltransferase (CMP-KDO synthetase)
MIEHVYHRTRMSRSLDEVYIATCDQEIMDAAKVFGALAVMTSAKDDA